MSKTKTFYGYKNTAFHGPCTRWFATREERDARLASLRDRACECGLSRTAAEFGIVAVECSARGSEREALEIACLHY